MLDALVQLNPMTPIIDAYRDVILLNTAPGVPFAVVAAVTVVFLGTAWLFVSSSRVQVRGEYLTWTPRVAFDNVSKKFRRGERHDSLRDLLPAHGRRRS